MSTATVAGTLRAQKTLPEQLLPWTALLGALVGAVFSGVQYIDAKDKARVDRAFAYVNEFKSEAMMKNHIIVQAVSDAVTSEYKQYREELARDPSLSAEQKKKFKTQFYFDAYIGRYRRNPEFSAAIGRLSLFYEEIAICAQEALCDPKTVLRFFQQGASDFLDNTKPILCEQRQIWNDTEGTVIAPAQQMLFKKTLLGCSEWSGRSPATAGQS